MKFPHRIPVRQAVVAGAVTTAVLLAPATPALAASTAPSPGPQATAACNAPVLDQTARHVLGTGNRISAAVQKLEDKGVDVRIRVFDSAPGGSLDSYLASQVRDCPSWQLEGKIKPNLIVILASLDRQDAVYGGAQEHQMAGSVNQIRGDLGGQFRAGHYADGILQAENETYSALYPSHLMDWIIIGIVVLAVIGAAVLDGSSGRSRRRGYSGYNYSYTDINIGGGSDGGGGGGGAFGSSGSW